VEHKVVTYGWLSRPQAGPLPPPPRGRPGTQGTGPGQVVVVVVVGLIKGFDFLTTKIDFLEKSIDI
jgi:hypothetical protein